MMQGILYFASSRMSQFVVLAQGRERRFFKTTDTVASRSLLEACNASSARFARMFSMQEQELILLVSQTSHAERSSRMEMELC